MTTDTRERDQRYIQRVEAQRDLRSQMGDLAGEDDQEVQAYEWSPGRRYVTLWSRVDGEEVSLPRYQAVMAVNTPHPTERGSAWTAHGPACDCGCDPSLRAPKARVNSVKCFLHPDSPYRAMLNEIGVSTICRSEHYPSEMIMWEVAESKHKTALRRYRDAIVQEERKARETKEDARTDAMLKLAGIKEK